RGSVPLDRVYLTNMSGERGQEFTVPNIDGDILVNIGNAYDNPTTYARPGYPIGGQVFIHELTHAWQIAHAPFTADVFWEAAKAKVDGESIAYTYGPPGREWHSFGLEQQGSIVDDWFAGSNQHIAAN